MDDDADSRLDNESIESYKNKQAIRQKPSALWKKNAMEMYTIARLFFYVMDKHGNAVNKIKIHAYFSFGYVCYSSL